MSDKTDVRIFSYGGGWQSTAVLALQILGEIEPFDYFVFANVGRDSEKREVFDYLNKWIYPACKQHGIEFVEVQKTRKGKPDTVLQSVYRDNRSVPIPIVLGTGAYASRSCTVDFKVKAVDKWIKQHAFTHATIGLGFSTDEMKRAENKPTEYHTEHTSHKFGFSKRYSFPLIEANVRRTDIPAIVERLGWGTPPKSACWFCPFSNRTHWIDMKKNDPELLDQAIHLQDFVNEKREHIGRGLVHIHRDGMDLRNVPNQMGLWDEYMDTDESCNEGVCGL